MSLAAWTNWGTSLPESLARSGKLVSRDAILLAWIGHAAGTLPRALRMAANTRSNQLPIWVAISARLSYIIGLLLAMQTITGFIMYFIVPKFEAIFKDFQPRTAPDHDPRSSMRRISAIKFGGTWRSSSF